MLKLEINKIKNKYHPTITIEHQTFYFIGFDIKQDAKWYLNSFKKAISFKPLEPMPFNEDLFNQIRSKQ